MNIVFWFYVFVFVEGAGGIAKRKARKKKGRKKSGCVD